MKILVVGGGGREHAIIKALRKNPAADVIYALPGNGGIAADAVCVPIKATDIEGIVRFAGEKHVDYAVVAPDDPLALGCVDELEKLGIPCFGPRKNAAVIEASKAFSKALMKKYGIPTAQHRTFTHMNEALAYVEKMGAPIVVKADGLALGKGVTVAMTVGEAKAAIREMMEGGKFGASGSTVVIEEYLEGPEVSVLSFTDGKTVVPMVSSMDHKRAHDGDAGPNTGGMGTVAPNPYYTPEVAQRCMDEIFVPTIKAMAAEGRPFKGCLYFGLMITRDGPKVIEYNCRFGDPETQVVLPLLESDLLTVMRAVTEERLAETEVKFSEKSAACVVLASKGYPVKYESGFEIELPKLGPDRDIFVAGAETRDGRLLSHGGRVLGCVAVEDTLEKAVAGAYETADAVRFENGFCRRDIGKRALDALKK